MRPWLEHAVGFSKNSSEHVFKLVESSSVPIFAHKPYKTRGVGDHRIEGFRFKSFEHSEAFTVDYFCFHNEEYTENGKLFGRKHRVGKT